jgi:hypothetical protein
MVLAGSWPGLVTAHHPGDVTISVTSGGITATTTLTVTG